MDYANPIVGVSNSNYRHSGVVHQGMGLVPDWTDDDALALLEKITKVRILRVGEYLALAQSESPSASVGSDGEA